MKYKFIRLDGSTWPVHSHHMLEKLGVKGTKWPDDGMAPRMVDGIKVWVTPRAPAANRQLGIKKSSTHRVMCECPGCGDHMSAGRLFQHKCDSYRRRREKLA